MDQLAVTNNYDKFELLNFNRDVNKTKQLESSMKQHGYIAAYPIHCIKNGHGKFKIKSGHHRYYVARKLGIPLYYVVCGDDASIFELEGATNPWKIRDYLTAHAREGKNKAYIKVLDYCDETGIGIRNSLSMLAGHSAGSGNFRKEFKCGTYRLRQGDDHAETVKDIILAAKKSGVDFASKDLFVQAVSKVCRVDGFSPSRLKSKIKLFSSFIERKANLQQYLDMIEDIYNRQSRDKIPLAFLAFQAAKERSAVKK